MFLQRSLDFSEMLGVCLDTSKIAYGDFSSIIFTFHVQVLSIDTENVDRVRQAERRTREKGRNPTVKI